MKKTKLGFIVAVFLFGSTNQLFGQEFINLSMGLGAWEGPNFGILYQLNQKQVGIGFGMWPSTWLWDEKDKLFTVTGDAYFHFGKVPKLSERRPWYLRTSLVYTDESSPNYPFKDYGNIFRLNFVERIGRDFNLAKEAGISVELGVDLGSIKSDPELYDYKFYLWPSAEVCMFFRIGQKKKGD